MDKETFEKAKLLTDKIDALEQHLQDLVHGSYDSNVTGVAKIVITEYLRWDNAKDFYDTEIYEQFMPDDWLDTYRNNAKKRLEELKQELKEL